MVEAADEIGRPPGRRSEGRIEAVDQQDFELATVIFGDEDAQD
jgi:hypothetical protein